MWISSQGDNLGALTPGVDNRWKSSQLLQELGVLAHGAEGLKGANRCVHPIDEGGEY
jgi:hypothetical protein